jgi:hypothetical protein
MLDGSRDEAFGMLLGFFILTHLSHACCRIRNHDLTPEMDLDSHHTEDVMVNKFSRNCCATRALTVAVNGAIS